MRFCFLFFLFIIIISCHSGKKVQATVVSEKITEEEVKQGMSLISDNDCYTCHSFERKLQGPSFNQVAERYSDKKKNTIVNLVDKVIKGGSGNWGDLPMTRHTQLSKQEAETIIKCILSSKK